MAKCPGQSDDKPAGVRLRPEEEARLMEYGQEEL